MAGLEQPGHEEILMLSMIRRLRHSLRGLPVNHQGQDLIEYVLIMALFALAAAAAMNSVASKINTVFTNVGTTLATYSS
jgi:Flp pilus assembly pilin Flp